MHRAVNTATAAEVDELRRAAVGPWSRGADLALRLLGKRRDPFALQAATEALTNGTTGRQRGAWYRYVRELDAADTLPVARAWMHGADDPSGGVAATLMALHGGPDDIPAIRDAFSRAWEHQWIYEICSLVEALGRHSDFGPFPELRLVFTEASYSYARRRAASAMSTVDPTFASTFAAECLWDCEAETRCVGIDTAELGERTIRARIDELAVDDAEGPTVRSMAVSRLRSGGHPAP